MTASDPAALARAEGLIAQTVDYPVEGVRFRDITPLLADGEALRAVVDELLRPFSGRFDLVAGVEARGFLLAGAAASVAGVGMVPIRKAGKLPRPQARAEYALEYGTAAIEMHADFAPGARVLVIDDVLATGGTLAAAVDLVDRVGGEVVGASVLLELDGLQGREALDGVATHAVFRASAH